MGREGFPEEVIDSEAATKAIVDAAAGLEKLNAIDGIDPVSLASIQLNAGGKCVGNLGQYMGVPEHSEVAEKIIGTVREAVETGADPAEAVADKLSFFVKHDENGELLRTGTEELKVIQSTLGNKPAAEDNLGKKKDNSVELKDEKPLVEPKPVIKKEIVKEIIPTASANDQKSHQFAQKVAAAQAELLRQRSSIDNPRQEHKTPKPSVAEKLHTTKPKPVEAPEKVAKPLALAKGTPEKPKTVVNTEITHKPIAPVAENIYPAEVGQIESTETFSLIADTWETEADITEIAGEPETEHEPDSEIAAIEILDTGSLPIDPDEFGIMEFGEAEDNIGQDGLFAELPPLGLELPYILWEGEDREKAPAQLVPSKQIAEHIETLEPAKSEEATAILEIVLEKIEQMQEYSEDSVETVDPEAIRQELEVLCARLLVCMDVEPTAERINYLIQTLTSEVEGRVANTIEDTEDQGTHERKQDIGLLMNDWRTWMDESLAHMVGQYAMQLTAPNSLAIMR